MVRVTVSSRISVPEMEPVGNTTSASPVLSVVRVMDGVDELPKVSAPTPPGTMVKSASALLSLAVMVTMPVSFLPKVKVELVALSMVSELAKVITPLTVMFENVGDDVLVKCCPVLKASSVSPMESAMTLKVAVSVAEVAALMVDESDRVTVSPMVMV